MPHASRGAAMASEKRLRIQDAYVKGSAMADSEQHTSTYRLLDRSGEVIEQRELPTDGEALSWAEDVRRHRTPRVWIRRLERKTGESWVYVSPAGDDS
jgi:hypothetical protein